MDKKMIGYKFHATGVRGCVFFSGEEKTCMISGDLSPVEHLTIEGCNNILQSIYDRDSTFVPGLTRIVSCNDDVVFKLVYENEGEYRYYFNHKEQAIGVLSYSDCFIFFCGRERIAEINIMFNRDVSKVEKDGFDIEPYYDVSIKEGLDCEYQLAILSFPSLRFGLDKELEPDLYYLPPIEEHLLSKKDDAIRVPIVERKHSPGVREEYRCKKCAEKLQYGMTICPKCGSTVEVELPYQEFSIIADVEPLPDNPHVLTPMIISGKTQPKQIIRALIDNHIINEGEYHEVGIIRKREYDPESDEIHMKYNYPDYKKDDIVCFSRMLTYKERDTAWEEYQKKSYSRFDLSRKYRITIELQDVWLISERNFHFPFVSSTKETSERTGTRRRFNKSITVYAFGRENAEDIQKRVRTMGYDVGSPGNWPTIMIPFENGTISARGLVCDIRNENIIMKAEMYL